VTPTVPCFACNGCGSVRMPSEYARTLHAVRIRISATPSKIAAATRVTHTATCNRLEKLRAWGFLQREKKGRSWVYFDPADGEPQPSQPPGSPTPVPLPEGER
jgi:hypothetical protein